jgi:hypothetical protein
MRVRIDQPGQHELAGDIDHFSRAGRQDVRLHRRDPAVANGDVPDAIDAGGRADDPAAAQKLVEGGADGHERSPLPSPAALVLPAKNAKYTSYLQQQTSCHNRALAKPIESSCSRECYEA